MERFALKLCFCFFSKELQSQPTFNWAAFLFISTEKAIFDLPLIQFTLLFLVLLFYAVLSSTCSILLFSIDCFYKVFSLSIDLILYQISFCFLMLFNTLFLSFPYSLSSRCPDFTTFINAPAVTLFLSIYMLLDNCKLTAC